MPDQKDKANKEPFDTLKEEMILLLTEISSNEDLTREELEGLKDRKNHAISLYLAQVYASHTEDDEEVFSPYFELFSEATVRYLNWENFRVVSWIVDCEDPQLSSVLRRRVSDYYLDKYLPTGQYEALGNTLSNTREMRDILSEEERGYISQQIYFQLTSDLKLLIQPLEPIDTSDRIEKIINILHISHDHSILSDSNYRQLMSDVHNYYFQNIFNDFNGYNFKHAAKTYSEIKALVEEGYLDQRLEEEIFDSMKRKIYSEIMDKTKKGNYQGIEILLNKEGLKDIFSEEELKNFVYDTYSFVVTNAKSPFDVWEILTLYSPKASENGLLTKRELQELRKRSLEVLPQKLIELLVGDEADKYVQISRFFTKHIYGLSTILPKHEKILLLRTFYTLLCKEISTRTTYKIFKDAKELPDIFFERYDFSPYTSELILYLGESEDIVDIVDKVKPKDFLTKETITQYLEYSNAIAYLDVISLAVQKKLGSKLLTKEEFTQWSIVLDQISRKRTVFVIVDELIKKEGDEGNMTAVKMLNDKSFPRDILDEIIDEYAKALERNSH